MAGTSGNNKGSQRSNSRPYTSNTRKTSSGAVPRARGAAGSGSSSKAPARKTNKSKHANKGILDRFLTVLFSLIIGLLSGARNIASLIADFFSGLDKRTKLIAVGGGAVLAGFILFIIIYSAATKPNGYEVYLNSSIIGIVRMETDLDEDSIKALVVNKLEEEATEKVQCYDAITVVARRSKNFTPLESVITEIARKITYRVQAAVITVDGERKAILKNMEEANKLLNDIKNEYNQEGYGIKAITFVENVDVILEYVDISQRMAYNTAFELLTSSEPVEDTHTVVKDENLTTIRLKYGMSEEGILAMNPGMRKQDILSIGTVLKITRPKPMISVKTIAEVTSINVIKYQTTYRDDSSMNKGVTKVITQGKDGQEELTERITRINGSETQRETINRVVLEPAQNEVIAKGTK